MWEGPQRPDRRSRREEAGRGAEAPPTFRMPRRLTDTGLIKGRFKTADDIKDPEIKELFALRDASDKLDREAIVKATEAKRAPPPPPSKPPSSR